MLESVENSELTSEGSDPAHASEPRVRREFTPSPYRDAVWETVGDSGGAVSFSPLELKIVGVSAAADPLFEQFAPSLASGVDRLWHSTTGKGQPSAVGSQSPSASIDLADYIPREEAEVEYQARFDAGYQQGVQVAREEAEAQEKERAEKFTELSASLRSQAQHLFTRIEKEAIKLSLAVAKKILITTADAKPDYIAQVIAEGIKSLGAAKPMRVRLSPEDLEFVEVVGLPPELSQQELGIKYVSDESIRSGCVIETDFGEIDLQLESMWEQVRENLFEVYR